MDDLRKSTKKGNERLVELKEKGNEYLKNKEYDKAIEAYNEGIL